MAEVLPPLSPAFRDAAVAEREKLVGQYEEAIAARDEYAALCQAAEERAALYARGILELGQILGIEDQLTIHELAPELRGERLREIASDVLLRNFKEGDVVHYRQWLDLVVGEGHRVGGRNAAATFLTQVARIPAVRRVGRRSGLYEVVSGTAA